MMCFSRSLPICSSTSAPRSVGSSGLVPMSIRISASLCVWGMSHANHVGGAGGRVGKVPMDPVEVAALECVVVDARDAGPPSCDLLRLCLVTLEELPVLASHFQPPVLNSQYWTRISHVLRTSSSRT